ncbi:putative RNA methyltransferase [Rhizomonospora bruguierae]|uniref:putative RNA methyltransferase n=1 Tax=Rhizomonospora bruguierae TaxID=1581705 RepID=UPI001BCCB982|nr:23S rRNA methyltransferase [Micromonospora sp. NBRC 107566]
MNDEVVAYLRCPVCREPLSARPGALRCPRGHGFDVARQGYVSLTAGPVPHTGDTAEMVAAREAFLGAGHYDFISAALAEAALPRYREGLVVDPGGGTGRHLAAVLAALPDAPGLTLDVSKPALRRAARAHPRAGAALADTWRRLPVADGAAGLILNVFAPRNGAEFRRALAPGGTLLVITPTAAHLGELVALSRRHQGSRGLLSVDPAKDQRVAASLAPHFVAGGAAPLERRLLLSRAEVRTAVGMGPSAWHTDPAALDEALAARPEPVAVTASVTLTAYRPRA